ncbi:hypothetical protein ACIQXF_03230 [Lysinibacillus sp. NPDC097231]|uniref:hypothetical protein n=1 Tax=Lysinibacillus sp. NPDC097231 TaxID=3364142 RepID=UPI003823CDEF
MKSKSMIAVYLGIFGFISLLVAHYIGDTSGESLSTLQITLIYIFMALGTLMFIFSIVLGVKGYRHSEVSKVLRYLGILFTPFLILLTIAFLFLIGWAAFL